MPVSQAQLKRRLERMHSPCACAKARAGQRIYLPRGRTIVTMNGGKRRPHRKVHVVCALDVHRHTHRRRMRNERMCWMIGRHDNVPSKGTRLGQHTVLTRWPRPKRRRRIRSTSHLPGASGRTRGCLSSGPLKISNFHVTNPDDRPDYDDN